MQMTLRLRLQRLHRSRQMRVRQLCVIAECSQTPASVSKSRHVMMVTRVQTTHVPLVTVVR